MAATGVWTWRVRGAKVPAVQKNDVRLEIDPAADFALLPRLPDRIDPSCCALPTPPGREVPGLRELVFVHDRHAARAAHELTCR